MTCKRCHPSENCTRYALLLLLNWCFWGSFFLLLLFFSIVSSILTYNVQWSEAKSREKTCSLFTCTWINWYTRVIFGNECVINRIRIIGSLWQNINKIVEIDTSSRNFDFMSDFIGRMNDRQNDDLVQIHASVMCGNDHFKHSHFIQYYTSHTIKTLARLLKSFLSF